MKTIQQAMLEEIYLKAHKTAVPTLGKPNQVVGESGPHTGEFYITLRQLEEILEEFQS